MTSHPNRLALAFYGDDFTGSTDALEFLTRAGLRTVLFIEPPNGAEAFDRFGALDAFGVAGLSRSLPPESMRGELRDAFNALRKLGPRHVHYKVCSTFDSSPTIGSIGCAIDVGAEIYGGRFVPVLAAAPALGRYTVFGNHFARVGIGSDGAIHRIDRHPVMSRHPSTPMDEADLRLHLARQTSRKVGLVDILDVASPQPCSVSLALERELGRGASIVLFDALHEQHLSQIGEVLHAEAAKSVGPLFSVGSSAIEMALGAHWRASEARPAAPALDARFDVAPLLVVSGSCSPVTDRQIAHALAAGFESIALDAASLCREPDTRDTRIDDAARHAARMIGAGRNVLVHTSRGKADTRLSTATGSTAETLGRALGGIARQVLANTSCRRVVVAGGDTSSHAARALGIKAVEMLATFSPGAPLCRAHATGSPADGIEINFKGGQVGTDDYFVRLAAGTRSLS
ncbi:four-carbon acid sugar kinase family protein [Opitutales bacterium ASA1]|uniref:four-carbon acid sugar kinase family protein n=1 Tax=Congregicoccus parvus TaxID=3081749 RepID=UPI002B2E1C39|nr:four-carbon acid sugar kinase family protein [Opitutales bacterium ASA1]